MEDFFRNPGELGKGIRALRKKANMNQSQLAEEAGIRQVTVSLVENGMPGTRIDTIFKILGALNVDITLTERKPLAIEDFEDMF